MPAESRPSDQPELARVHAVLDEFHAAASVADEERYFSCLAPDVVYLGTDATERWAGEEFRTFVHSYFSRGKGWTYTPSSRTVCISGDSRSAWFDEELESDWAGTCRGTGVLVLHDDAWRIEQYSLTVPIPNEVVDDVVTRIRELGR